MFFVFASILDWYKTQEICDRVISEDPFLTGYCPDKYKTQRICALKPISRFVCYK